VETTAELGDADFEIGGGPPEDSSAELQQDFVDVLEEQDHGEVSDLLADNSTPIDDAAPDLGGDMADGLLSCSESAPPAPQELACLQWTCTPTEAPQCWDCLFSPVDDGGICKLPGQLPGKCMQGSCLPLTSPDLNGPFSSSQHEAELKLSGGWFGTTIPLTLYLPEADTTRPVVVFHHGFQLTPTQYASYGEHLASWGFVVVMPEMPGGVFGLGAPSHLELKEYLGAVLDWIAADAATGTDGDLLGRADPERIGLAGHSMGGKISLLLATEDDRPLAVFGIDPVDAAGSPLPVSEEDYPSVTPELMDQIGVPLALLGETTNGTCEGFMCQACAPEEDNFHQYYLHAVSPSVEIEVLGASHMSFLDDPDCGMVCSVCPSGTDAPAETRMLTRRFMTAFFLVFLSEESGYIHWLAGAGMTAEVDAGLVSFESKNGF
jgi:dienelactone hydrolase